MEDGRAWKIEDGGREDVVAARLVAEGCRGILKDKKLAFVMSRSVSKCWGELTLRNERGVLSCCCLSSREKTSSVEIVYYPLCSEALVRNWLYGG